MTELSREQTRLSKIVEVYLRYKDVLKGITEDKELLHDPDLCDIAKEELVSYEKEKVDIENQLQILLLPYDPNDEKNVIVEIRGAAGGDEANLFAGDLFDMYSHYAEANNWKVEITNAIDNVILSK